MHPYPQGFSPVARRPGAPKTLGILSIVFGSLVTLSSLGGFFAKGLFKPQGFSRVAWDKYLDEIATGQMINSGLLAAMSIALIVIGVGQLKYRRWAPKASIYWSMAGIVVLAIMFVVHLTVLGPAMQRFFTENASALGAQMGGMSNGMALVSLLLYLPYPIVLFVQFRKPDVVAAMTN